GVSGKVPWRLHHTDKDFIDLAGFYNYRGPGVAYAACWLHTEKARPVLLSVGSDDGIKIWMNRKPVLDRPVARAAAPGQDVVKADLTAGWNQLLVKVDNI